MQHDERSCSAAVGNTMQHDERSYTVDAVLGERTNNSTDARAIVQMQQWQWQNHGQQYRIQQCKGWWAATLASAQGPMPNDQSNTQ